MSCLNQEEHAFKFGDHVRLGETNYVGIIRGKATVNLPAKSTGWIVELPQDYVDMYHKETNLYFTHAKWLESDLKLITVRFN